MNKLSRTLMIKFENFDIKFENFNSQTFEKSWFMLFLYWTIIELSKTLRNSSHFTASTLQPRLYSVDFTVSTLQPRLYSLFFTASTLHRRLYSLDFTASTLQRRNDFDFDFNLPSHLLFFVARDIYTFLRLQITCF